MKILLVHYRFFVTGGPERYLFNTIKALKSRGHEIVPFSIKNSHNVENEYSQWFIENIGGSDEVFYTSYPKTLRSLVVETWGQVPVSEYLRDKI